MSDLTAAAIVAATGCPRPAVERNWPLILSALVEMGIGSRPVQIAAAATIAVEVPGFQPLRELRANRERQPDLWAEQERYWPSGFYARGYGITWERNYRRAGQVLGLDLVGHPDLAMDPAIAARCLAVFFRDEGIAPVAEAGDWLGVRRIYNGPGTRGRDHFLAVTAKLTKEPTA